MDRTFRRDLKTTHQQNRGFLPYYIISCMLSFHRESLNVDLHHDILPFFPLRYMLFMLPFIRELQPLCKVQIKTRQAPSGWRPEGHQTSICKQKQNLFDHPSRRAYYCSESESSHSFFIPQVLDDSLHLLPITSQKRCKQSGDVKPG